LTPAELKKLEANLWQSADTLDEDVTGKQATVDFLGLWDGLAGLEKQYQKYLKAHDGEDLAAGAIDKQNKVQCPIFQNIEIILKEIDNLKQTRDRLLTRLISGKLSVEDLEIQFPPSMTTDP
jgi:hypothetical protein